MRSTGKLAFAYAFHEERPIVLCILERTNAPLKKRR